MLVKQIKVVRKIGIDYEPQDYPGDDKHERPPLKLFFSPANHNRPDERRDPQKHKHVVGQREDEGERQQRPIFSLK